MRCLFLFWFFDGAVAVPVVDGADSVVFVAVLVDLFVFGVIGVVVGVSVAVVGITADVGGTKSFTNGFIRRGHGIVVLTHDDLGLSG